MRRQQRFNFKKFERRWDDEKKVLPTLIARTAENQFKDNFRMGGFLDGSVIPWAGRKIADAGRALLVKTGRLKRSIRAAPGYNFDHIKIASDVPYARYIQEGTKTMPPRKIIGESQALTSKIKMYIKKSLTKIFS